MTPQAEHDVSCPACRSYAVVDIRLSRDNKPAYHCLTCGTTWRFQQ